MRKISLILIAVVVLFVACREDKLPDNVMNSDQMVDFLTEAYMLEGLYAVENNHQYDSIGGDYLSAYDDILKRHNLTREQVTTSVDYYMARPEEYAKMNEKVTNCLASSTSEAGRQR